MTQKNLLITGLPRVGKTTLIRKLSEALKDFHPVGFYTKEIKEEGDRKGFELIGLEGTRRLLSHKEIESLFRVGRYRVNIESLEGFLSSISFFNSLSRVIILDEIGKMECLSNRFKRLVREALDSEKWVIATVAFKGEGLIAEVKERKDVKLFEVTAMTETLCFRKSWER